MLKFITMPPVTSFFCNFSIYFNQFIIYDLCDKYYKILKLSNNIIELYLKYEPSFENRYHIRKVIEKFEENENDFKYIVYPLRKLIYYNLFIINLISLFLFKQFIDSNTCLSTKIYLLITISLWDLFLISTQIIIKFKSRIQTNLLKNISTWINSNNNVFVGKLVPKISSYNQSNDNNVVIPETCDELPIIASIVPSDFQSLIGQPPIEYIDNSS